MRLGTGSPAGQRARIAEAVTDLEERVDRLEGATSPEIGSDAAAELINRHGLDPRRIAGTGADGAIIKGDVETYLEGLRARGELPAADGDDGDGS